MAVKTSKNRGKRRSSARRRHPLTRERVVQEALALVDEEGLEAMTMRRLGDRLGVEAMSLYGHVEGKHGLVEGIIELLWLEVERSAGSDGNWRQTLASLARHLRGLASDHPNAFPLVASSSSLVEPMLRTLRHGLAMLREAGFDDERAAKTLNAVIGYASGYGAMELSCSGVAGGDGGNELDDVIGVVQALPRDLPPELVRVVRDCYACNLDEQFEFGLEALLTGLDR